MNRIPQLAIRWLVMGLVYLAGRAEAQPVAERARLLQTRPSFGGKTTGDSMTAAAFRAQVPQLRMNTGYLGQHPIQIDRQLRITAFSVKVLRKGVLVFDLPDCADSRLPAALLDFVRDESRPGDHILIYDIDVLLYAREHHRLAATMELRLSR